MPNFRFSAQGPEKKEKRTDGPHVVEYVRQPPWRDAGKPQKIRAGSRREASIVAGELRSSGSKVTAVRRKRWFE